MGNWPKVIVLLVVISLGFGFGGYLFYKNYYVKPRAEIAKKHDELVNAIDNGKKMTEQMVADTTAFEPLYTRSFPLSRADAALQYETWLSQMLEFCNIRDFQVSRLTYESPRNSGLATQNFRVQAKCDLVDLTQFLYEFYWTPFLHRISTLNISPVEGSDKLQITMTIQGLTILFRTNRNQAFPLQNQLPLSANAPQQLASGPFAAYKPLGDMDFFRSVPTGIDQTALAVLTGVPTITDDEGNSVTVSRWNLESEGRTITLKVGDEMKIGSFVATIDDIDEYFVVLRQSNGLRWMVLLGYKLSDATAVPPNLF
ncbi:MAG: hypothetical protein IJL92_09920 [Thermoguttaceae bacterium]|nr:hypothetical protein [Thermoguttaceae bacterium]